MYKTLQTKNMINNKFLAVLLQTNDYKNYKYSIIDIHKQYITS